jgi:radial spoke head protein 9
LWIGYVGYHRLNTQIYGGLYIGNGIKNYDLPFQLYGN